MIFKLIIRIIMCIISYMESGTYALDFSNPHISYRIFRRWWQSPKCYWPECDRTWSPRQVRHTFYLCVNKMYLVSSHVQQPQHLCESTKLLKISTLGKYSWGGKVNKYRSVIIICRCILQEETLGKHM